MEKNRDINKGIDLAADLIGKKIKAFMEQEGSLDPDTGALEFKGDGALYVQELEELQEEILGLKVEDQSTFFESMANRKPCSMGVGCEDVGVCYASAVGEPNRCGRL